MTRAKRPLATLRARGIACAVLLLLACALTAPSVAVAQGEAAAMERIYQACRDSGGRAASNYNDWVAQNGCVCGGVGSGAQTCAAASNSASGSSASSDANASLMNSAAQGVVQGLMSGDAQLTSVGVFGLILADTLQGDPAADAERARQAALAVEQQRRAQEMRNLEYSRQQELSRQRILGELKGSASPTGLTVKMGDSAIPVNVALTQGAFGSVGVVPIKSESTIASGGLQLKLGDAAEGNSDRARQGFDTPGTILGSELPAPPPNPTARLLEDRSLRIAGLNHLLKLTESESHALSDKLATLEQAPAPDPVAIGKLKEQIASNETEKKKLMLDLSAEDPDAPPHEPVTAEPVAAPSGAPKGATP